MWLVLAVAHAPGFLVWAAPALLGLAVEQALRVAAGRGAPIVELSALRSGVTASKSAGQLVSLTAPATTCSCAYRRSPATEWHPFTITSAPQSAVLTVHVRSLGNWTSTLKQSPHPGDTVLCGPAACGCCGHDLTGEPVLGTVQKRQVFEASPPPPPVVTEYQVAAKCCPACGEISVGLAPAGVTGRVQYGPGVHAKAALAVCAHYLPVARAARLVAALTGVNVSAGFVAGIRGKAARLLSPFMDRVRELLPAAGVLYADETPARAAGKLHYVHVACTEFLTAMHTGDRTKEAIDAGEVLPGYAGTIVRDGYKGYEHLTNALHAWCGAHGLRDLAGLYRSGPDGQIWARSMADLLIDANAQATAARAAGQASLNDAGLAGIRCWYRGAVAKGFTDNTGKTSQIAKDGLTLARRFRDHEDMILRFATDLAIGFTSNQAERDVRPVKVQQRTSGGTWRTLLGLADFAIVQSYLSTAGKWGIDALDALTRLFTDGPWLPPATAPP